MKNNLDLSAPINNILQVVLGHFKSSKLPRPHGIEFPP